MLSGLDTGPGLWAWRMGQDDFWAGTTFLVWVLALEGGVAVPPLPLHFLKPLRG